MYNDSVNAADNWRRNYDIAAALAGSRWERIQFHRRNRPIYLIVGVMIGVLGTLLAAQAFTI